jgi:hypothetical protein
MIANFREIQQNQFIYHIDFLEDFLCPRPINWRGIWDNVFANRIFSEPLTEGTQYNFSIAIIIVLLQV